VQVVEEAEEYRLLRVYKGLEEEEAAEAHM
jgi:hypothetical protein